MRPLRALPLVWKILLPFLLLILLLGSVGALVVVRDLSTRAEKAIDEDILRRSLAAQSSLSGKELYLLESANFAANIQGMAEAVRRHDVGTVTELLRSVLALKVELDSVTVTDGNGSSVATLGRHGDSPTAADVIARAVVGERAAGLVRAGATSAVAVASPVCSGTERCEPVGAVVATAGLESVVTAAVPPPAGDVGVAILDTAAHPLASAGSVAPAPLPTGISSRIRDRSQRVTGGGTATLVSPYLLAGQPAGLLATSVRTAPAFAAARRAGVGLAVIFLATIAGVTLVGVLLARYLLGHIRRLLDTNRRLGSGDLSARVPVTDDDELGQLARGFNAMADELQGSYETLEARVAARTDEVRALLEERTTFFTSLSHELRTPLAVIRTEADLLRDKGAAATIKQSAEQLISVVDDILRIAEAEAGGIDVEVEPVQLGSLLRELKGPVAGLARGAGVTATVRVPRQLPAVQADPVRLREVVLNLVGNAAKYTAPGGRIEVRASASNGSVRLDVSDTGVGIPPEVGDRIFEPFYRVPGVSPHAGQPATGLGLAVTKRLVDAQGGSISFASEPGEGTTFTVALPVAEPDQRPR